MNQHATMDQLLEADLKSISLKRGNKDKKWYIKPQLSVQTPSTYTAHRTCICDSDADCVFIKELLKLYFEDMMGSKSPNQGYHWIHGTFLP
jgi:hypothetical protein